MCMYMYYIDERKMKIVMSTYYIKTLHRIIKFKA